MTSPSASGAAGCAGRCGRWREGLCVALLLSLFAWQGLSAAWHKSNTFDETAHLASGYAAWKFGDYTLQPEIGNLPQRIAALPLLGRRVSWPAGEPVDARHANGFLRGQQVLYELDNDPEALLHLARIGVLLAALALGLTVYLWSRRLHGPAGGLVSLSIFSFCPTMLAHGPMITADVTAALFFLLASWGFWELLDRVTPGRALAAGAALGGLCLSKHSAALFAPVAATLLVVRVLSARPLAFGRGPEPRLAGTRLSRAAVVSAAAGAVLLTAWVVIWGAYGLRFAPTAAPLADGAGTFAAAWGQFSSGSPLVDSVLDALRRSRLLPEAYLYGFKSALGGARSRLGFLAGSLSMNGWWWFFPYALLVKTPLSVFAIWGTALATGLPAVRRAGGGSRPAGWWPSLPIWTLLIVYWVAAMRANLNIGHRHVLLTYPALAVLCGILGPAVAARGRLFRAWALLLFLGLVGESLAVRPHYLAFFNAAAGGPARGYRHLVDSSLDWGQDLPTLKAWLDRNAGGEPVFLSYFGTSSPRHYGIRAFEQPHFGIAVRHDNPAYFRPLQPGVYCISATHFQNVQLPLPDPWNVQSEAAYQNLRPVYEAMLANHVDPADFSRVSPPLRGAYRDFAALRWGRLCAFLRSRDRLPDASAGHSILIFRLSAQDLREALAGPMPLDPLRVEG